MMPSSPKDLQERLNSVFSALDQHNPHETHPAWSISRQNVRVVGDDDSSDSESCGEDHKEGVKLLQRIDEEDGTSMSLGLPFPSASACKAFKTEDDEDEYDRLACESLQKLRCHPKPALKTKVADRNIYDRFSGYESPRDLPLSPSSTPTLAEINAVYGSQHMNRKKVRFRETDEFSEECGRKLSSQAGNGNAQFPQIKQKLSSGEAAVVQDRSPKQGTICFNAAHSKKSSSFVPEHVRRPEAFVRYELDVPIVVGSGVDGTPDPLTSCEAGQKVTMGDPYAGLDKGKSSYHPTTGGFGCQPVGSGSACLSDKEYHGAKELKEEEKRLNSASNAVDSILGGSPRGDSQSTQKMEFVQFMPTEARHQRSNDSDREDPRATSIPKDSHPYFSFSSAIEPSRNIRTFLDHTSICSGLPGSPPDTDEQMCLLEEGESENETAVQERMTAAQGGFRVGTRSRHVRSKRQDDD